MAFATNLNTIRVYGTLGVYGTETSTTEQAEGVVGSITFRPSAVLVDVASNQVLYPEENAITVNLTPADNGVFSVRLAATDDPQLSPTGWTWTATENFSNAGGEKTFNFSLPVASPSSEQKYASLRGGEAASSGVSSFIPLSDKGVANGVATLDGTTKVPVAQLGTGSAGAGLLFLADDRTWKSAGAGSGGDPTLSGDVTGLGSANTIANNAVTTVKILDGNVTTAKLANGAVDSSKIADGTIVNADVSATAAIAETKVSLASDAAAGTPSRRSLGTGATQAAAGNHVHSTLYPARSEAVGVVNAGADPDTPRPTAGFLSYLWLCLLRPNNMDPDNDLWIDPEGLADIEDFMASFTTGSPFAGTPGKGSVLGWNTTSGAWNATVGQVDSYRFSSSEAVAGWNSFIGFQWILRETRRQVSVFSPGTAAATWATSGWTGAASAPSEIFGTVGHLRTTMDLRSATNMRLHVSMGGTAPTGSAAMRVQYSKDNGSHFQYMDGAWSTSTSNAGSGPSVTVTTANRVLTSGWTPLHADAQAESVTVRVVGISATTGQSPTFGNITIETRGDIT